MATLRSPALKKRRGWKQFFIHLSAWVKLSAKENKERKCICIEGVIPSDKTGRYDGVIFICFLSESSQEIKK